MPMASPKLNGRFLEQKREHDLIYLPPDSHQLQSSILPALAHQIKTLSSAIDPSNSQNDPKRRLKLLVEVSHQLEQMLERFCSCLLPPDAFKVHNEDHPQNPDSASPNSSMRAISTFKYYIVIWEAMKLNKRIYRLLITCRNLMKSFHLDVLMMRPNSSENHDTLNLIKPFKMKRKMEEYTADSLGVIDKLNRVLDQSECSTIQEKWKETVREMECGLEFFTDLTQIRKKRSDRRGMWVLRPSKEAIRAGRWACALCKLARMFFNKLSQTAVNTDFLRAFSRINLEDLFLLWDLTGALFIDFIHLMDVFHEDHNEFDDDDDHLETENPIELIRSIHKPLQTSLCILNKFLDSLPPQFGHQVFLHKTWFKVWDDQFSFVVQRLTKAVRSMDW